MFNILAENLHIKQSNKSRVVHHLCFYFPASFTAFFPLVKLTWFQWFDLFFLIHFFLYKFFSILLFTTCLGSWFFLIFNLFLFSGQCISLFPPVSFVFLYKTDLNNSLFQMVIQGHSEQKMKVPFSIGGITFLCELGY